MSKEEKNNELMEKIVSLAKRRGFVFQGSEIYGGLAGTFDWGHYGVALKNNIKQSWWKKFVDGRRDMYGVDAAILMRQEVWQASGHVGNFSDPMVECKKCNSKFRVDFLVTNHEEFLGFKQMSEKVLLFLIKQKLSEADVSLGEGKKIISLVESTKSIKISDEEKTSLVNGLTERLNELINQVKVNQRSVEVLFEEIEKSKKYNGIVIDFYLNRFVLCPNFSCKAHDSWTNSQQFNMMFQTKVGALDDSSAISYLRPETAQGMFVNFKNTVDAFHPKLPFGMAQIGKAFRNEITPRDFLFRQREFEQMEIEYFVREEEWKKHFEYWKDEIMEWMEEVGIDMSKVEPIEISDEDRAFYSKQTIDFEFKYPFGQKELFGLAYRTDYDLGVHKLDYIDEENAKKIVPHVIEPSFGLDRAILAVLFSAYQEDESGDEVRPYLKFKPSIAPVICAVSPLLKNKPELVAYANDKVFAPLKAEFGRVVWDDNGNIGKRYRRQDEIGTPYCIVVDFETLDDEAVTVRDRDTAKQERVKVTELVSYIKNKLN